MSKTTDEINVRECTTVVEFDECVRLQREAFALPDLELSPRRHLVVARSAGGWTLGAFDGERLVGFVLTQVAVRSVCDEAPGITPLDAHTNADAAPREEVIGYSHMMAVAKDCQNRGVGARLKWAQRERAMREGRRFICWTWEPLQSRNAHFNLARLGVVVRNYSVNYYGTDYSAVAGEHGTKYGIDSDRLIAAWHLDSPHVASLARGESPAMRCTPAASVEIPPHWSALIREDAQAARREQVRVRDEFQRALAAGLVCAGFERDPVRPRYLFFDSSKFKV